MSDGLTAARPSEPLDAPPDAARRGVGVAAVQALVTVAVFTAVGAGAGWLWHRLWDAPRGVVAGGVWYTDEAGLREDFSGVALYVVIAAAAGLALGVLTSWFLDRSELVTLAAVLVGSVLAGYVMLLVGHHLSPPDPQQAAQGAADGTRLDGQLRVDAWPPRAAFPFGALLGLAVVFAASMSRSPSEPEPHPSSSAASPRG